MKMRDKKRGLVLRLTPMVELTRAELEVASALTQVRRARAAMLRNPVALAEIKNHIKLMDKSAARTVRKMVAEDMKLLRQMERQERRRA